MDATDTTAIMAPAFTAKPLVSIVIPVLNECAGVPHLIASLHAVMDGAGVTWEVLFVDDGSTDTTLDVIKSINAREPRVTAISLSRNFGKERAIAAGLEYARGDAVILMDADLQHPPETLLAFIEKWREGFAIVYGQRLDRDTDGWLRRFLSRGFYRLYRALTRTALPDGSGDFRLLDRRAVDAMNRLGERSRFNKGLYSWIGFRSIGVPYAVQERTTGISKWSGRRLFGFALDGLMSFSTIPLKIWSVLGLIVSAFAIGYALVFLMRTIVFGNDLPGFPTLAISIMFFSGVQLLSLGVLGEYLGRVYEEVKARPLFLVAEEIGTMRSADARREPHRAAGAAHGHQQTGHVP